MNGHPDIVRQPGATPLLAVMPGLAWTQIRAAAVDYAAHGWPVLPGTYQLAEHGGWLGKREAVGLEPVADLWPTAATADPGTAMEWWTRRPYSVLLACGHAVNAVEVPTAHTRSVLALLADGQRGPVAITPFGSSLFFVRAGDGPLREDRGAQVRIHAAGAWLPLPPTSRDGFPYRWLVRPSSVGWRRPTAVAVGRTLARCLPCPFIGTEPGTRVNQ